MFTVNYRVLLFLGNVFVKGAERSQIEIWKSNVIIVCTVTAAVEIVIVVIIVLYWRQIRWTLRKIKCPCVSTQSLLDFLLKDN